MPVVLVVLVLLLVVLLVLLLVLLLAVLVVVLRLSPVHRVLSTPPMPQSSPSVVSVSSFTPPGAHPPPSPFTP